MADTQFIRQFVSTTLAALLMTHVASKESVMLLTQAEKRILQAALREFIASAESDFRTLRECHSFRRAGDDQVDVEALAEKLGVNRTRK